MIKAKIYVASSWRNPYQQHVVAALRQDGHTVYDFQHPTGTSSTGFSWIEVGEQLKFANHWKTWTVEQYQKALKHPLAVKGFVQDYNALKACDTVVFVAPAGVSAALEFGYACGAEKVTILYMPEPLREPDLMFKMCDRVCTTMSELRKLCKG